MLYWVGFLKKTNHSPWLLDGEIRTEMANNRMIVSERSRQVGSFLVGRLLPFRKKRQVGPFTFIDHMGPAEMGPGSYSDVDQHPHIGLSTLTYLLSGAIEHKDSTGAVQVISAGDVGFMTSGKGVTHTERTPKSLRDGKRFTLHGYQLWVALPVGKEEVSPHFQYLPASDVVTWQQGGLKIRLVAGEGFGKKSPLQVYSHLFMVDILAEEDQLLDLRGELQGEIAVVVVAGEVMDSGERVSAGEMLISTVPDECCLHVIPGTRLLLFGGEPLNEERFMFWNFVHSSKDRIEQAKKAWREHEFPKVPDDKTYIPLP